MIRSILICSRFIHHHIMFFQSCVTLILTFLAGVRTMGGAVGGPMMAAGGRLAGKGVKVCWCVCWCWCICWCWWNSARRSDTGANGDPVAPGADPRPRSELCTRKRLFSSCRRRSCSAKKESEGGKRRERGRGRDTGGKEKGTRAASEFSQQR